MAERSGQGLSFSKKLARRKLVCCTMNRPPDTFETLTFTGRLPRIEGPVEATCEAQNFKTLQKIEPRSSKWLASGSAAPAHPLLLSNTR